MGRALADLVQCISCVSFCNLGNIVLHTEGLLDNSLNLRGPLRVRGAQLLLSSTPNFFLHHLGEACPMLS